MSASTEAVPSSDQRLSPVRSVATDERGARSIDPHDGGSNQADDRQTLKIREARTPTQIPVLAGADGMIATTRFSRDLWSIRSAMAAPAGTQRPFRIASNPAGTPRDSASNDSNADSVGHDHPGLAQFAAQLVYRYRTDGTIAQRQRVLPGTSQAQPVRFVPRPTVPSILPRSLGSIRPSPLLPQTTTVGTSKTQNVRNMSTRAAQFSETPDLH